jgi:hypothetical protein
MGRARHSWRSLALSPRPEYPFESEEPMKHVLLPVCPSCGSSKVKANGRDGSSRYAQNTTYVAWMCECGKSFTVGHETIKLATNTIKIA